MGEFDPGRIHSLIQNTFILFSTHNTTSLFSNRQTHFPTISKSRNLPSLPQTLKRHFHHPPPSQNKSTATHNATVFRLSYPPPYTHHPTKTPLSLSPASLLSSHHM